jgi:alcohol dehydrogenase class IV
MWELSIISGSMRMFPKISCLQKLDLLTLNVKIRPIGAIREATELVKTAQADVLVSIGGGSPIDSAKAVAYQIHEQTGKWIPRIAVPTTLSVAETTQNAGFTTEEKKKIAVSHPELVPKGLTSLFKPCCKI